MCTLFKMDKNDIRAKCRKVYIVTTNGHIFGDGHGGNEHEFVPVFRSQERAETNVSDREACQTKIYNLDRFGKPKQPPEKLKAVAVYLVPASKIDD